MSLTKAEPVVRATDELRQIKHELLGPPSQAGNGWTVSRVIGYHYTVQRKWLVFDGIDEGTMVVIESCDGTMINGVKGRPEWRDLPTVTEAEAAQQS